MKINFTQVTIYLTSLVSFLSFRLFFFLGSFAPKLASLNPFRSSFRPVCFRRLSSIRYLLTSVNYFLLFYFIYSFSSRIWVCGRGFMVGFGDSALDPP
jgi:hypothetical protein